MCRWMEEKNSDLSEEFMAEFSKSRAVKVIENTSLIVSDTTTTMQSAESTTDAEAIVAGVIFQRCEFWSCVQMCSGGLLVRS